MIKIVIIDSNNEDRNRIQAFLASQEDIKISAVGKDAYAAFTLVQSKKPDIALIDVGSNAMDEIEIIPLLYAKSPATAVVFLGAQADEKQIYKAIQYEVRGFVLKSDDPNALIAAVRRVHQGGRFTSPAIRDKTYRMCSQVIKDMDVGKKYPTPLPKNPPNAPKPSILKKISSTELKIMVCITKGHSTREIAERFSLTDGTIRNYLSSGMKKAGLQSRTQVPLFIIRHGLIEVTSPYA